MDTMHCYKVNLCATRHPQFTRTVLLDDDDDDDGDIDNSKKSFFLKFIGVALINKITYFCVWFFLSSMPYPMLRALSFLPH